MNKEKQFLKDLLAYVRFVHNHPGYSSKEKYAAIVSTIGHDLNGVINEDAFFSPRVSGYAQSPRAVYDAERLATL